jgi:quercetin dioxygenase-like cupin family protein
MVVSGQLRFTIGDETRECGPGDMYLIPSNVPHTVMAVGGPAVALDVFTPIREDYAARTNRYV